jgi:hypothetical protein
MPAMILTEINIFEPVCRFAEFLRTAVRIFFHQVSQKASAFAGRQAVAAQ